MRSKTFLEENATIEIEEVTDTTVTMTVTITNKYGSVTWTKFYHNNLTFEEVIDCYKKLGYMYC